MRMTDEDKTYLLKELTRTLDESDSTAAFCLCQRWILKDALALLKEQEAELLQQEAELNILRNIYRQENPTKQAVKWNE